MNYCSVCGYKLEGEYNFCPNCGSKLDTLSVSSVKDGKGNELTVCKNCGEENPLENVNCFSCGVPLKATKNKKYISNNPERKETNYNKSGNSRHSENVISNTKEKYLDSKKILIISVVVIMVFIAAMIFSGVFNSGNQTSISQTNNNSGSNGVSLENLNEITDLENNIKSNPEDIESVLHLAHLQQDSKLFEKAIENYKKYLAKNPKDADARVDMGICFYNLKDYKSAIGEMETALKYQPEHQIACLNLGIVNLTAQNLEAAKEWFKKAVGIDPNSEAGKRAQELLNSH